MSAGPTVWWAFLAGLLSFVSPCCLPLFPSYISYISGVSFQSTDVSDSADRRGVRRKALMHAIFFVIGFSIIFIALGMSASVIGSLFLGYRDTLRQVGAVLIIAMGLFVVGILKMDFLLREKKWMMRRKPAGYWGAVLVGISFAAGWTPCIGPILASVLVLAATNAISGMTLMLFYIVGFAIPFLILAYSLGSIRWLVRHSGWMSRVGGVVMIVMGVLLFTNSLTLITRWLIHLYGGFTGF